MTTESFFSADDLDVLAEWAIDTEIVAPARRPLLLRGISARVRYALPHSNIPSDQIRLDLNALNTIAAEDGQRHPPLDAWLGNAAAIAPRGAARAIFTPYRADLRARLGEGAAVRRRPETLLIRLTLDGAQDAAAVITQLRALVGAEVARLTVVAQAEGEISLEGPPAVIARIVARLRRKGETRARVFAVLRLLDVAWGTAEWTTRVRLQDPPLGVVAEAPTVDPPRPSARFAQLLVPAVVLVGLGGAAGHGVSQITAPEPVVECRPGTRRVGDRCLIEDVRCPTGSAAVNGECVVQAAPICTAGTWDAARRGCVGKALTPKCNGKWSGGKCVVRTVTCPPGSKKQGGRCVARSFTCPDGSPPEGGRCVAKRVECPPHARRFGNHCVARVGCPDGSRQVGDRCVRAAVCPAGSARRGDQCLARVTCPAGSRPQGDRCVRDDAVCPRGSRPQGDRCVRVAVTCPSGSAKRAGRCVATTPVVCPGTSRWDGRQCVAPLARGPRPPRGID